MLSFKSQEPNFAAMLQAIQAIRELHLPEFDGEYTYCLHCWDLEKKHEFCSSVDSNYPCETIKILDKYDIL